MADNIRDYISDNLNKGYSEEQITNSLIKIGYEKEEIKKAFYESSSGNIMLKIKENMLVLKILGVVILLVVIFLVVFTVLFSEGSVKENGTPADDLDTLKTDYTNDSFNIEYIKRSAYSEFTTSYIESDYGDDPYTYGENKIVKRTIVNETLKADLSFYVKSPQEILIKFNSEEYEGMMINEEKSIQNGDYEVIIKLVSISFISFNNSENQAVFESIYTSKDKCSGSLNNTLVEHFCEGDSCYSKHVTCQCMDGQCELVPYSSSECTDSDGGNNPFLKGTAKNQSGSYDDVCRNINQLLEYYCDTDTYNYADKRSLYYDYIDCTFGCKDGVCVKPPDNSKCKDSEIGLFGQGQISFSGIDFVKSDYCMGHSVNAEYSLLSLDYFCSDDDIMGLVEYECKYNCLLGKCLDVGAKVECSILRESDSYYDIQYKNRIDDVEIYATTDFLYICKDNENYADYLAFDIRGGSYWLPNQINSKYVALSNKSGLYVYDIDKKNMLTVEKSQTSLPSLYEDYMSYSKENADVILYDIQSGTKEEVETENDPELFNQYYEQNMPFSIKYHPSNYKIRLSNDFLLYKTLNGLVVYDRKTKKKTSIDLNLSELNFYDIYGDKIIISFSSKNVSSYSILTGETEIIKGLPENSVIYMIDGDYLLYYYYDKTSYISYYGLMNMNSKEHKDLGSITPLYIKGNEFHYVDNKELKFKMRII